MTIEIENTYNASVGDYVSVDMKETILAGAVIFCGITIMAIIIGILLGWMITPSLVSESLQEPVLSRFTGTSRLWFCQYILIE